jgi:hypothetical protein
MENTGRTDERHRGCSCERDGGPVATYELLEPIPSGVRSREDRTALQESLQVMGERGRRLIAALFVLLQRGHHDQIEVAAQPSRQRARRPARWLRWHVHAHDPLDVGGQPPAKVVRPLAGEQQVEQHT